MCMTSGNRDKSWPIQCGQSPCDFIFEWSGSMWSACGHWLNINMDDMRRPIIFVSQSVISMWHVISLQQLARAVINLDQSALSITWSGYHNGSWDLWIMTIGISCPILAERAVCWCPPFLSCMVLWFSKMFLFRGEPMCISMGQYKQSIMIS